MDSSVRASREFQVFTKPIGAACNLACSYCYYIGKERLYPETASTRMTEGVLEAYIRQHIAASPGKDIHFLWHGGEPTLLGVDYFRAVTKLQRQYCPPDRRIGNVMQTNGTRIDDEWCRFFSEQGFSIGLSLDGPQDLHDLYRSARDGSPTQELALQGYHLLQRYDIPCDILCVVNAANVCHPDRVYRFFKEINASYIGFLPYVERDLSRKTGVSDGTVPAKALGDFLCHIFDEWKKEDIGRIVIQNIEEVARAGLDQEHALCIFRPVCGDAPAIEHNGDFYSCDHYVDSIHRLGNILETPLVEMLEGEAQRIFGDNKKRTLPRCCVDCSFLDMCNGGCPKDRFCQAPDGEPGLNYLCEGYRQFFAHCQSFYNALRLQSQVRKGKLTAGKGGTAGGQGRTKVGRNDPCPCGSGRKYKKCCMGRQVSLWG